MTEYERRKCIWFSFWFIACYQYSIHQSRKRRQSGEWGRWQLWQCQPLKFCCTWYLFVQLFLLTMVHWQLAGSLMDTGGFNQTRWFQLSPYLAVDRSTLNCLLRSLRGVQLKFKGLEYLLPQTLPSQTACLLALGLKQDFAVVSCALGKKQKYEAGSENEVQ